MAGQAVGAHDRTLFRQAVKITTGWGVLFSILFGLAYWLFGQAVVDILSTVPEVREARMDYRLITGAGEVLRGRMMIYDGLYGETRQIALKPRSDCPVCGRKDQADQT